MSKNKGGFTANTRAVPQFAHDFVHKEQNRAFLQLFQTLGLKKEHSPRVYTTFEMPGIYIGWRGHKGQWYKHPLQNGTAGIDDEELTALKLKVMMSTC